MIMVWWGPSDSWGKLMLLGLLKKFEVKPEDSLDLEVCDYSYRVWMQLLFMNVNI